MGLSPLLRQLCIFSETKVINILILKAQLIWHFVTFVTHNSRVSERMNNYNSREFIANLQPHIFDTEKRKFITQYIVEQCVNHNIKVAALNILPDHVHILLGASDKKDLDNKMQLIKGGSSFKYRKNIDTIEEKNIWAQKYHNENIKDEAHLLSIIEYINNNHYKHSEKWGVKIIEDYNNFLYPIIKKIIIERDELND
jgi:REP element-mobilizing transposase RayT